MASNERKVVILGGGLTGISAALHSRLPWAIYERDSKLGGLAVSEQRQGYWFDVTGHWLHLRDPGIKALVGEVLPDQMVSVTRRARVHSHGVTTLYPFQANLYGLPPEVIKECLLGVIEARLRPADTAEPRNFEEYCLRHFGAGISKHFMVPYNQRLWGVHPREITAAWCSRFVPLPNLEQIVAGAVGANQEQMGYNVAFQYPRQGGIEPLAHALAGRLRGEVHLNASLESLDFCKREVVVGGERIPYRALVATLPLPELLARMPGLPTEIEHHAARLRCTTLRYLNLATKSRPRADWHWVYVPEKRFPFFRAGIYSNAVASMAPPGGGSMYVELADRGPVTDSTRRDVAQGLAEMGAIASADDVLFAEAREIRYAYVVFDDHYYPAMQAIHPFLESHGIYARGRYGAWTYNAMEDCLIAGREVAATIEAAHGSPTP